MIAKQTVELDAAKARQNLRLVESLEDLDDVSARHGQLRHPRGGLRRGRWVIVLGIDPGTAALGYGIVETTRGRLARGRLRLPRRRRRTPRCRSGCSAIHALLDELIELHRPRVMAVERLFFSRNAQTAFGVGQARGVVLLAAAQPGVPVREATPNEVKIAVTGYGAADKEQVQRMVAVCSGSPRCHDPTTPPTPWRSPSGRPTADEPGAAPPRRRSWIAPRSRRSRADASGYERGRARSARARRDEPRPRGPVPLSAARRRRGAAGPRSARGSADGSRR